jgi:hypothetical protein
LGREALIFRKLDIFHGVHCSVMRNCDGLLVTGEETESTVQKKHFLIKVEKENKN